MAGAGGFGSGGARRNKLTAGPRAAASLVAKARRPGGLDRAAACGGAEPARRFACPHASTVETRCVALWWSVSCRAPHPGRRARDGGSAGHAMQIRSNTCACVRVFSFREEYICVVIRQVFPSSIGDERHVEGARTIPRTYVNVKLWRGDGRRRCDFLARRGEAKRPPVRRCRCRRGVAQRSRFGSRFRRRARENHYQEPVAPSFQRDGSHPTFCSPRARGLSYGHAKVHGPTRRHSYFFR